MLHNVLSPSFLICVQINRLLVFKPLFLKYDPLYARSNNTPTIDNGATILSNSWGGTAYSTLLEDAVNYAVFFTMTPANMNIPQAANYRWQIQIRNATGDVATLKVPVEGLAIIKPVLKKDIT